MSKISTGNRKEIMDTKLRFLIQKLEDTAYNHGYEAANSVLLVGISTSSTNALRRRNVDAAYAERQRAWDRILEYVEGEE